MSTLPWVVAPRQHVPRRVGTLDSGILEIPVLGGLTVEEANTITELLAGDVSAFVQGAQLADAIAQAEGITQVEAFAIIEQAISGQKLEERAEVIRLRFAERIEAVTRVYTTSGQRSMEASVTAILRHRLGMPGWSMADTQRQPKVLLADIWQLILDEQAAESMPANRPTEEELGKRQRGSGSSRKRTGPPSSGDSATPIQVPSPETASAAS